MARLTTRFWVDAYLQRLSAMFIPAYITVHGDDAAGAVLVKVCLPDRSARIMQRAPGESTRWIMMLDGTEAEVDETLRRQRSFDPDLWIVEIESRDGSDLLDAMEAP